MVRDRGGLRGKAVRVAVADGFVVGFLGSDGGKGHVRLEETADELQGIEREGSQTGAAGFFVGEGDRQTDGSNEAFRSLPAGPSAHRHR